MPLWHGFHEIPSVFTGCWYDTNNHHWFLQATICLPNKWFIMRFLLLPPNRQSVSHKHTHTAVLTHLSNGILTRREFQDTLGNKVILGYYRQPKACRWIHVMIDITLIAFLTAQNPWRLYRMTPAQGNGALNPAPGTRFHPSKRPRLQSPDVPPHLQNNRAGREAALLCPTADDWCLRNLHE